MEAHGASLLVLAGRSATAGAIHEEGRANLVGHVGGQSRSTESDYISLVLQHLLRDNAFEVVRRIQGGVCPMDRRRLPPSRAVTCVVRERGQGRA